MRVASDLLTSKVTWAAVAAIVAGLGGALTGELSWTECAVAVFAALQVAFVRDTIARGCEQLSDGALTNAKMVNHWQKETHRELCRNNDQLRQALQVMAENSDRALTIAGLVADQAAALTSAQADPLRQALQRARYEAPPGGVKQPRFEAPPGGVKQPRFEAPPGGVVKR